MPTELPDDMPTFSLGDAESVGIFPNGHPAARIADLLMEAKLVASSVELSSLIDQRQVELFRGENSEAAFGDVFSYSPMKVIYHKSYMDHFLPGDVIRAGSGFVRLVE